MTTRIAIPDPEVVQRFDRPGPRYTSYPTAVEFHDGVGESAYREHLARANREHAGEPLSLYIHIPFCAKHCSYCGCHVIATPKREIAREKKEERRAINRQEHYRLQREMWRARRQNGSSMSAGT